METGNDDHKMSLMNHNGIDVGSPAEVDRAHEILTAVKEEYRIRQIHPVRHQQGAYCFNVLDLGGNWWEILANRAGGYSYAYDDPGRDITGPHDLVLGDTDHMMTRWRRGCAARCLEVGPATFTLGNGALGVNDPGDN